MSQKTTTTNSGQKFSKSLKAFAIMFIVTQIVSGLLYGFQYSYSTNSSNFEIIGQTTTVALLILLLIGFGLMNTYISKFSISGFFFTLLILSMTIQQFFIFRSFWIYTGIQSNDLVGGFGSDSFDQITLIDRDDSTSTTFSGSSTTSFNELFACAISMCVAMMPNLGKIGPTQIFFMCFFGVFIYTLNQSVFQTLDIQDTGLGMRVFLFGSVMGIISSILYGKKVETMDNINYFSLRRSQIFALLGSIFVWCFLPWLSIVSYTRVSNLSYLEISPINVFLALSVSCCTTFALSCLINNKVSVHDVIFSSFTGGIAYSSSANIMRNPMPAMLISFIVAAITTLQNSKAKKPLNKTGIIDAQGVLFTFLVPSFIGAIYSSILIAVDAQNSDSSIRGFANRTKFIQGGYQLAGMFITIGLAILAGLIAGLLYRCFSPYEYAENFFIDEAYIKTNEKNQIKAQE